MKPIYIPPKITTIKGVKMKVGFFRIIGLFGLLAEELTIAAEDGKITVAEAIKIVTRICEALGIDFDATGFDLPQ